jgi:guanylate kinase
MTGASGVGKDTIRRAALLNLSNLFYSISATTRSQRSGEAHGKQYYFYDRPTFEKMIGNDELLEYAEYVGDYYGTPESPVKTTLNAGQEVKHTYPSAVMIFIAPPTMSELERRLRGRETDSEEKIQKRLARAREEIKAVKEFDYVVINDTLTEAVADFSCVIRAERARAQHLTQQDVTSFLQEF